MLVIYYFTPWEDMEYNSISTKYLLYVYSVFVY